MAPSILLSIINVQRKNFVKVLYKPILRMAKTPNPLQMFQMSQKFAKHHLSYQLIDVLNFRRIDSQVSIF